MCNNLLTYVVPQWIYNILKYVTRDNLLAYFYRSRQIIHTNTHTHTHTHTQEEN